MSVIKAIFDEISTEPSTNKKMEILTKYKDNETLKRVLYLAKSKRIKFYIKKIPLRNEHADSWFSLENALENLIPLYKREVTGNEAIKHLYGVLSCLSPQDAYVIERVIDKDLKIGMGSTQINKIYPNLIEKTPYMGALSYNEKQVDEMFLPTEEDPEPEAYSDVKEDGRFNNTIIRGGDVEFESRQGERAYINSAKLAKELEKFPDCVLNGEFIIPNVSRYISNGLIASAITICNKEAEGKDITKELAKFLKEEGQTLEEVLDSIHYRVWDTLSVDEFYDKKGLETLRVRRKKLHKIVDESGCENIQVVRYNIVKSALEAKNHFTEELIAGNEGTILKRADSLWIDGKKKHAIKMKLEMDVDLKIVGFNYGAKGTKNEFLISSLNAESSCGRVKTKPQGLKEDMMKHVTENQEQLLGTIVECKSCGLSNDSKGNYALLHPAFVRLRDDKFEADDLDTIISIEKMVKGLS